MRVDLFVIEMFNSCDEVDFAKVVGDIIETPELLKLSLEFFMFHWYSVLETMEQVHHRVV
jgi:hypothetical protein